VPHVQQQQARQEQRSEEHDQHEKCHITPPDYPQTTTLRDIF
jgi:hypothetical protein